MTSTTQSAWQASHGQAIPRTGRFLRIFDRLWLAYKVYRERQALLALSDDELRDIGLSRADARREANRPLWDLPEIR